MLPRWAVVVVPAQYEVSVEKAISGLSADRKSIRFECGEKVVVRWWVRPFVGILMRHQTRMRLKAAKEQSGSVAAAT